jgi:RNA polymerase sigma-70 factor (sigma-E family)
MVARRGKWIGTRKRVWGVGQLEFTEFYRAERDRCLRAVLAIVSDRQLAEDLVAEAFTRAWMSWQKVRRHPVPRAWVVRTALNLRVSWWRRRRREIALGEAYDIADATCRDPTMEPRLLAVLRQLPRRQREVIVFRVFLDLDTETTAQALGMARGTVTAHLSRAVATLRAQLVTEHSREGEA